MKSQNKEKSNRHKEDMEQEKEITSKMNQSEGNEQQEINNDQTQGDTQKLAELNDRYIRLVAEFDNYRRRVAKEKMDLVVNAAEDTIIGLLPVLDDFERAIDMLSKSQGDIKAALEGTELIFNKLYLYLSAKGLKKIEASGEDLDTDFHEAVAQLPVEGKNKKNKIVDIVQQGYTLNGKVIRFAKVVVGV